MGKKAELAQREQASAVFAKGEELRFLCKGI